INMYRNSLLKVEVDMLAKSYLPGFEKKLFINEVKDEDDNPYKIFRDSLQYIESSIHEVNKGIYSVSGYNYFSIIKSTLVQIKKLPKDDVDKLLDLLAKLVVNNKQAPDAKV